MSTTEINIPGYKVKEELFRSDRTIIYRALREKDKTNVIIKSLNTQYPSNEEITRFKHEFHITQKGQSLIRPPLTRQGSSAQ